jgi:transcriptional regulator with XRE-family HTH domain
MPTLDDVDIGAEICQRRAHRRLSQRELAAATEGRVSQSTIARIEDGSRTPLPRVIRALESVLGRLDEPDPLTSISETPA